jgi:uncharacterized protein (DUF362 family)
MASRGITRRGLLAGAGGLATGAVGLRVGQGLWREWSQPEAPVAVVPAPRYDADLAQIIGEGLALFPDLPVRGRRVLLKPNLVEVDPARPINTDARVVHGAIEAFRRAGAAEVVVAEGPGHHRDTELLLRMADLDAVLRDTGARFVDLNIAPTRPVSFVHDLTGLGQMSLPVPLLEADLVVSMPKLKTHHWVGATLSLKNLFGVVPGAVYGWPKNVLHHHGIDRSIVDLWTTLRPGFAIVDGIVGMEGDGPIMGVAKDVGVLVMGTQLPAVDATAARIMGLAPERMGYLAACGRLGGTVAAGRILQRGERPAPAPFALLPRLQHLADG